MAGTNIFKSAFSAIKSAFKFESDVVTTALYGNPASSNLPPSNLNNALSSDWTNPTPRWAQQVTQAYRLKNRGLNFGLYHPIVSGLADYITNNVVGNDPIEVLYETVIPERTINSLTDWWLHEQAVGQFATDGSNLIETLRNVFRLSYIDGDSFLIKKYDTVAKETLFYVTNGRVCYPFQNGYVQNASDGNRMVGGVLLNQYNRPLGYYISLNYEMPNAYVQYGGTNGVFNLIKHGDAYMVVVNGRQVDQPRGEPATQAVGAYVEMLISIDAAFMATAQKNAGIWYAVKQDPNLTAPPVNNNSNGFVTETVDTLDGLVRAQADADRLIYNNKLAGGVIKLDAGVDVVDITSKVSINEYVAFRQELLKMIAIGMNMPFHIITQDYSKVNYSSARIANISIYEYFTNLQDRLKRDALIHIYRLKLDKAIMDGKIDLRDVNINDERISQAIYNPEFVMRTWTSLEPDKQAHGLLTLVKNNILTRTDVMKMLGNNRDIRKQAQLIAQEHKVLTEAGLSTNIDLPASAPANNTESSTDAQTD